MKKEKDIEFYKRCPTKGCLTICGFFLPKSEIKKNGKYLCSSCNKEYNLRKWKAETRKKYKIQQEIRGK